MTLRVGSLFTGYGGLDLAIGGDLAWYSEIDKAACQVLATHHPNVPNLGDITKINWSDVEPVDILTGGYPCQPFSHAGNRKGKNDERHLWPYVLDAICAIRPRYAILENVSGHLTLGFADVLADLAQIGWSCEWGTFRASDVGAPHRRERLFIVAYADSQRSQGTDTGLDLAEGRRNPRGHAATSIDVAAADTKHDGWNGRTVARGVGESQDQGRLQQSERRDSNIATNAGGDGHGEQLHTGTMAGMEGQATRSPQQRQRSRGKLDSRGVDDAADTDNGHGQTIGRVQGLRGRHASRGDMPEVSTVENTNVADTAGSGSQGRSDQDSDNAEASGQRSSESARGGGEPVDWGKYAPAISRWELTLGRPAPAPTTSGRNDRPRLNPQFVEWMMGLPEGWVTGHGLTAAQELKMLGNGVVPQQAHAAITQLLERTQP